MRLWCAAYRIANGFSQHLHTLLARRMFRLRLLLRQFGTRLYAVPHADYTFKARSFRSPETRASRAVCNVRAVITHPFVALEIPARSRAAKFRH